MNTFINGAIMMEFLVAAAFFLRYWRRTGDQLFFMFSLAFLMMAGNRLVIDVFAEQEQVNEERKAWIYGVRLLAFILILIGIVIKNRRVRPTRPGATIDPPDLQDSTAAGAPSR